MTDPISDMLTRIRNAGSAQLPVVEVPHSKLKESIANVLKAEGYVTSVEVAEPSWHLVQLRKSCGKSVSLYRMPA